MLKILFVCMGNICRSPAAEGIMRYLTEENHLQDQIYIDSAGTLDYHSGECADSRMLKYALERGYDLNPHRARVFDPVSDFKEFDYIITMDNQNYYEIRAMDRKNLYSKKIYKIMSFALKYNEDEVPDPYYGGKPAFTFVLDMLEDACGGLLEKIKNELSHKKQN